MEIKGDIGEPEGNVDGEARWASRGKSEPSFPRHQDESQASFFFPLPLVSHSGNQETGRDNSPEQTGNWLDYQNPRVASGLSTCSGGKRAGGGPVLP